MSLPEFSLILDIAMVALLAAVIVYAVRLNRHMSALQKSKRELEEMLAGFSVSTERAEAAVNRIKAEAGANRDDLKTLLREAEKLRDDLAFMVERGGAIADKLETGISRGRSESGSAPKGVAPAPAGEASAPTTGLVASPDLRHDKPEERRKSKSDLLKALQGMR